jgi:hypothetical protein
VLGVVPVSGLEFTVDTFGPEFRAFVRELERLGGCAAPVLLMGHTITRDRQTGAVVHAFRSADLPYGVLVVPCRNRRESVCLPCALLHNGDSFAIVRAGLAGGKGVPEVVSTHPRVFATVTAPSFGAVHKAKGDGPCRPRRERPVCPHGRPLYCYQVHAAAEPVVGSALCLECYDYMGAVIWNAGSGKLWPKYIDRIGRELAKAVGLRRERGLWAQVRVSYVKVAEFQRRGSVHFHAVIRLDGPGGPDHEPPGWASGALLVSAAKAAAARARVAVPDVGGGRRLLVLGDSPDAQEITPEGRNGGLSDQQVASYIAKYVTKGDLPGLILPRRLGSRGAIERAPLTEHARSLMRAAWDAGGLPEFAALNLRDWAHQVGFRGNVVTKSRRYSTTYKALREARAQYWRAQSGQEVPDPATTVRESNWRLVGVGLSPELGEIAAGIAEGARARTGQPDWTRARAGDAT